MSAHGIRLIAADPTVLAGLLIAAAWYGVGVRRVWTTAGAGRGVTRAQVWCYVAGLATLAAALASPLDAVADDLFSAHMVQHLLLISVAAPLLVLGHPLVPMLWALPRAWRNSLGRRWGTRSALRTAAAALAVPGVAWALHGITLAVWHVPAAYDYALAHEPVHAVEHLSFLATACLFWWVALPGRGGRRLSYGGAILYVTAMAAIMGIYGAVLTFARSPWYTAYGARTADWGLTPLADQQLAGLIMWIPTGVIYLGAALWCFAAWMTAEERRAVLNN